MKKCLICQKRKAQRVEPYGYLPCKVCQKIKVARPVNVEITTDQIRDDRKKYADDLLQPFRDGELSGEYAKRYPNRVKEMIKENHVKESEVTNAKPVWELNYYKDI